MDVSLASVPGAAAAGEAKRRLIQSGRWSKSICLCDTTGVTEKQRSLLA